MIYQPRNVQPSYSAIDGSKDNIFTMEINTSNYINAYKLTILNWDNTVFYQGNKVDTSENVYNGDFLNIEVPSSIALVNGKDYKWNVNLYQPEANMKITSSTVKDDGTASTIYIANNINIKPGMKLKINNQIKDIVTYTMDLDVGYAECTVSSGFAPAPIFGTVYEVYSDFIQTLPEYILYVREAPEVSITNMPVKVTNKIYEFKGEYGQINTNPLIYHQWLLYVIDQDGNKELLRDTGRVNSANLTFEYDGFKNGERYDIKLLVQTQYGTTGDTGFESFVVEYDTIEYLEEPEAVIEDRYNAVKINWKAPTNYKGMLFNLSDTVGTVKDLPITDTSLYVDKGLNITPFVDFIFINKTTLDYITYYDPSTGLLMSLFGRIGTVLPGAIYRIGHYSGDSLEKLDIHKNTPYDYTTSVFSNKNVISYTNIAAGTNIIDFPENYRITSQFKISDNFFYGYENTYRNFLILSFLLGGYQDSVLGTYMIYIHNYSIGILSAETNSSGVVYHQLPEASHTAKEIYVGIDIDIEKNPFILLVAGNYVERIESFDPITKKVTLENSLPYIPKAGEVFTKITSNQAPFYIPNEVFSVQLTTLTDSHKDYVWLDDSVWPNNEEGNYWVEGGGPEKRIAENWWKIEATKNNFKIEKGGK